MYQAMKNAQTEVTLQHPASSSSAVFDQYRKILDNHPEIFYVDTVIYYSDGVVKFKYKYPRATILKMNKALNQQADKIVNQAKQKKTQFEKVLTIHDAVVNSVRYDEANLEKGTLPDLDYTAYGALVNKTAVCDGYAKAMNLLLNRAGIWSVKVTGTANGEDHAWNLVKVDGKYYYLDSTWDDPVSFDKTDILRYKYFLVTGSQLAKDHKWNQSSYPKATSTTYSRLQHLSDFVRYNNSIYYVDSINNEIYKTDIWGKKPVKFLSTHAASLKIKNNTIYYINLDNNNYIYKIHTNGTGNQPAVKTTALTLGMTGNEIKYLDEASNFRETRI
jgi:transglutaminase/protease-like cytokinesis protein 3